MPVTVTGEEWRRQNASTAWPFSYDRTLLTQDGRQFPTGAILDASLHPQNAGSGLHLSLVSVTADGIALRIEDSSGVSASTARLNPAAAPSIVQLYGAYGRSAGILECDPALLASVQSWGIGEYRFDGRAAEFVSMVCYCRRYDGLTGIIVESSQDYLGDDVWFVAGAGVSFEVATSSEVSTVTVHFVGDPQRAAALCDPSPSLPGAGISLRSSGSAIALVPDARGNINFDSSIGLRVTAEGSTVTISRGL